MSKGRLNQDAYKTIWIGYLKSVTQELKILKGDLVSPKVKGTGNLNINLFKNISFQSVHSGVKIQKGICKNLRTRISDKSDFLGFAYVG